MSQIRYSIDLNYISNNKEINIDYKSINYIVIDYDYDNRHMPIIYLTLNLEKNMMDDMILNADKNTITLNISKFDNSLETKVKTDSVKDQFIYFIPSDTNYRKDLDDDAEVTDQTVYSTITIGLLKMDLLNNNKQLINDIFIDTNKITIIHHYTKHMKMLIEPFEFDNVEKTYIIPPLESVTQLLKYLNNYSAFYSTKYRYFMDFDKTYLISTKGNAIESDDGEYSSVIINVRSVATSQAQSVGMNIDAKQKLYSLDVDALNTNMNINRVSDKSFNYLLTVTANGTNSTVDLNINRSKLSTKKPIIHRLYNDNINLTKNLKNMYESSAVILNFTKSEIDGSIFTINKQYSINNFSTYSNLDGGFLLSYKKEVYKPEGEFFITNTIFGFRKIIS